MREHLIRNGADLVGYGDLRGQAEADLPSGVSIAVAIPREVILSISDGPTPLYYEAYSRINAELNRLAELCAGYLRERGFKASPQSSTISVTSDDDGTRLPHKTVATRTGMGWIGRCALLVTREFGSAVRIISVLTDAELECGVPENEGRCGDCRACVEHCPAQAIQGNAWRIDTGRSELVDTHKCRQTARTLTAERLGREMTICGKCIEICPYTRSYLRRME